MDSDASLKSEATSNLVLLLAGCSIMCGSDNHYVSVTKQIILHLIFSSCFTISNTNTIIKFDSLGWKRFSARPFCLLHGEAEL